MNRRQWMMLSGAAMAARGPSAHARQAPVSPDSPADTPDRFLLADYQPVSMAYNELMLHTTFRILETHAEHFYVHELFNYHWPLYGFGLPGPVLKKVYGENARRAFARARSHGSKL